MYEAISKGGERTARFGRSAQRRRHGFTLVELLVVIGVIAVLISLLLPALNKARVQARRTACMSNLRQLGISMNLYLVAFKGTFPPHRENATVVNNEPGTGWWGTVMQPFIKSKEILQCPDMANDLQVVNGIPWTPGYDPQGVSYGYNGFFLGYWAYQFPGGPDSTISIATPQNWTKITQVKKSSETLVFADSSPPNLWSLWWPKASSYTAATGIGGEGVTTSRHKGVGCVVFVDGHCEMRKNERDPSSPFKYFPDNINPATNAVTLPSALPSNALRWWDPKQRTWAK